MTEYTNIVSTLVVSNLEALYREKEKLLAVSHLEFNLDFYTLGKQDFSIMEELDFSNIKSISFGGKGIPDAFYRYIIPNPTYYNNSIKIKN